MLGMIKKAAETSPQKTAYIYGSQKITYSELWSQAEVAAELIIRQGNEPVILLGGKEPDMITGIVACLIAGRAYVPVDSSIPINRLQKIISLSGATLILSDQSISFACPVEILSLNQLKKYSAAPKNKPCGDTAYIIFTSGSTGEPKGVPISRNNLKNFVRWISSLYPLSQLKDACVLNQASFSFDLSVADIYFSLCNAHTLAALPCRTLDLNLIFDTIKSNNVNATVATPSFIRLCLTDKSFNSNNLPSLDCIYFCGEMLSVSTVNKLFRAFPNIKIINAYGPTEATSAVSASLITKEIAETEPVLPAGLIESAATQISLSPDGEIILKGESVSRGYLGSEQGGFFDDDGVPCFRTGDIGKISDGKLYCLGRIDDCIKFNGYRIELGDIESNLSRIDGVKNCAVTVKRGVNGEVRLIAAYYTADLPLDPAKIKNELKKNLPEYMIPKVLRQIDFIPMNQNGKTDRKTLIKL